MSALIDLNQAGRTLHKRLLSEQDTLVTAEIAETFLPPLVKALMNKFSNRLDAHLIETIAEDVLLDYFANPQKFDPSKSSLIGYLYRAARGDLLNHFKKDKKVVELDTLATEYLVESVEEAFLGKELSPGTCKTLESVKDPVDREIVQLMIEGVRETRAYAIVLGIEGLPPREQKAIVKKNKDRIKKALQREYMRQSKKTR